MQGSPEDPGVIPRVMKVGTHSSPPLDNSRYSFQVLLPSVNFLEKARPTRFSIESIILILRGLDRGNLRPAQSEEWRKCSCLGGLFEIRGC
jgi:hypothetical protein